MAGGLNSSNDGMMQSTSIRTQSNKSLDAMEWRDRFLIRLVKGLRIILR